MKKALSILLCLIFAVSVSVPAFAAEESRLSFGSDGKFKIMIFTDIHEGGTGGGEAGRQIMREALRKCQPDLVVYLGDNTIGDTMDEHRESAELITEPVRELNIPFAVIFGNHDSQSEGVEREALLEMYREMGSIAYDAEPELYGCGNYNLPIYSSDGKKTAANLWFFDSGSDNPDEKIGGYDYIRDDQLNWYAQTASALREQNGGKPVPALVFQHINVADAYEKMFPRLPLALGDATYNLEDGSAYSLVPRFSGYEGIVYERLSTPKVKTNELAVMREAGDVMACFSGHDHVNAYRVELDGIDCICVPTIHNKSYSNDGLRGAGLITLDENKPGEYEYKLIRACELCFEDGSKICDMEDSTSKFGYFIAGKFVDTVLFFQRIFNSLRAFFGM